MPYTDIRDGLVHNGHTPVLFRNHGRDTRDVIVPLPPLRTIWTVTTGVPDFEDEPIRTVRFTLPALHDLYADGTIRRSTGYIPPHTATSAATTPEENTAMPTTTPVVTTVEEAATALARFQDILAREAENNGHPREYRELIERAVAEIPGLRAATPVDYRPQGNFHISLRITIPDANPNANRDTIHDAFSQVVRRWADENGHASLSREQKFVAYAFAHPEIVDFTSAHTSGYLDNYSVTNRRNQGAATGRVEFVTE